MSFGPISIAGFAAAGGGGGWTPASVTTSFWYDADDVTTIFTDAGTTQATNGQTVQQWNDKSGNNKHLSQSTAANRPTYTTGLQNSKAGIVLTNSTDANTDFMTTASFSVTQPYTVFFAYKPVNTEGFAILWIGDASYTGGKPVFITKHGGFSSHAVIDAGATIDGGVVNTDGTSYTAYATFSTSGTLKISTGSAVNGSTGTNTLAAGIAIGATASGNRWGGNVYEIFCIPSASGTDITNAISYFSSKWAL